MILALSLALGAQFHVNRANAEDGDKTQPDKSACAQAFEDAQREQRDMRYVAANQSLFECANPSCGDLLFGECSRMYRELQEAMPTVVFSARDAQTNHDRTDVTVTMDGQPFLERIDGRPVATDPGAHHFVFSMSGRDPVEQDYVIRAGDKLRQIAVLFDVPAPVQSKTEPTKRATPATKPMRSIPTASSALGGIGLVAIGTFTAFRIVGAKDYDDLNQHCAPSCSQSDASRVKREYAVSNIAAAVGGAAVASAVVFYFAASKGSAVQVSPEAAGLSAHWTTRF